MSVILHEERDACGLTLIVSADPDPINPRTEFEQLGTLACWHRRHSLGDRHHWLSPEEFEMAMEERPHIRLPVFMYDHVRLDLHFAEAPMFGMLNRPGFAGGWFV